MPAAQIVELSDVARNVIVEINSGDRRLAAIVIGSERQGQCATAARLVFEGRNERPPHATQTTIPPDDERVQLPDTPVVLGKPTDPPKQEGVLQRAEGKALMEYAFHFHGRRLRVRPAPGMVEAFHKQGRSLPVNNTRLATEIGNPQIDRLLKGVLKRRCRIRATG